MTIEEMRERKKALGYSYEQISELSGLPVGTVQKVLGGITKSPRYDTLSALEKVLGEHTDDHATDRLHESRAYYGPVKKQGEYTLEDYYALPDERRAELIDGVIYDLASPSNIHQIIGGQIFRRFADYIERSHGQCVPAYAPLDVQLDCDDRTMVQPDVLIVCDRGKFKRGVVYGAPDLVVEIMSKSTWKKDLYTKSMKYAQAGVREYWMIDPDKKRILVYDFGHNEFPAIYGFDDVVPVGIFDGMCKVDFSEIYEYVSSLYEQD